MLIPFNGPCQLLSPWDRSVPWHLLLSHLAEISSVWGVCLPICYTQKGWLPGPHIAEALMFNVAISGESL